MNTLESYFTFFEGQATDHPLIKSSARISMNAPPGERLYYLQEHLEKARDIETPYLITEAFVSEVIDNFSDNKLFKNTGAFFVLKYSSESFPLEAYNTCEIIARELAVNMKTYFNRPDIIVDYDFQLRNVTFDRIGPIGDKMFGTRCDFWYYANAMVILQ